MCHLARKQQQVIVLGLMGRTLGKELDNPVSTLISVINYLHDIEEIT